MDGGGNPAVGLADQLAFQHLVAGLDDRARVPPMLWCSGTTRSMESAPGDRRAERLGLVGRRLDATRELEQVHQHQAASFSGAGLDFDDRVFPLPVIDGFGDSFHVMHSTGQGGRHSSQPVHCWPMMTCICLAAPMMASTGQAWMHSVQPIQVFSSMMATCLGFSSASSGLTSRPSRSARRCTPSMPPGGHRLISARPWRWLRRRALRPTGKPHWPHCVCGRMASIFVDQRVALDLNLIEA